MRRAVINTEKESLDAERGAFDVVIDAVGREIPEGPFATLRRGGRLIALQEPPSQDMARRRPGNTVLIIQD
jgi:protein-L-isoaspartate O-methyltransferase